jgi:RNA polymerase sigma-70 factor (ECF subfamily)
LEALRKETDEQKLVEAAQRDPRCFAELYELHFHRVYAYAAGRLHTREEAEDVTSAVFHQALAKIKSFEWRGAPFSAWLIRIAANAIHDRWKNSARESLQSISGRSEGGLEKDRLEKDGLEKYGSENDLEDTHAEDAEQQAVLFQLVERLPADQRRVVMMRFIEQKSIREIAKEIRKTEGAVKQLQFRALQKLRAQMEGADA